MEITQLNERGKTILKLVIDNYIDTGNPIGSFSLVKNYDLPWSSATVRCALGELTGIGFITQPHASAGRVPTEKGIRFYLDFLLTKTDLPMEKKVYIKRRYREIQGTLDEVVAETSSVLSDFTSFAGLATVSRASYMTIKSAEIVKLGESKVLVIFVLEGGITEKTLIRMNRRVHPDMLERMSRYLNDIAVGFTIEEVKTKVLNQVKSEKEAYRDLVQSLLGIKKGLNKKVRSEIYIKGQSSIVEKSQITNPAQIRDLVRALEEKDMLLGILETAMKGEGTKVFVGNTNGVMEGYSLIVAPYGKERTLGTVGVLGPMRMNYSEIIPLVEYTAGLVSKLVAEGGM